MNKEEALQKIHLSLSTVEAQVITPKGETYEKHVEKLAEMLIDSVIDPVRVNVTSACALEGEYELYKKSVVWGIARSRGSWLLTLENEMEFALGFGDSADNIMMHGFSSNDVLGEWCT